MKSIKLTRGRVALVDDLDYKNLCGFNWQASTNGYAQRSSSLGKGVRTMHRDILGDKNGYEIDHINGNKDEQTNLTERTNQPNP